MKKAAIPLIAVVVLCILLAGCSKEADSPAGRKRLVVVTTLFPLYDFARHVGGDMVHVRLLLPPGVEPHSFEPKPSDVVTINNADLFIYTGSFMEPWAADIVKGLAGKGPVIVDASKDISLQRTERQKGGHGHSHGDNRPDNADPHIWLDFANAVKMVGTIGGAMAAKDPAHREIYENNAAKYAGGIKALDDAYREALSKCPKRVIVHGGHFAFNYLAMRYDLKYVSAYRGGGETEPSPRDVAAMVRLLRAEGLRHVFYEELLSPRLSETIAREVGGSLLKLHGAHNVAKEEMQRGVTFISLMEDNLNSLKTGLLCR